MDHHGSPLRDVLDAGCKKAKIERRFTPHGLRPTANDLLRRVAGGDVVRSILGHATPQMTHHVEGATTEPKSENPAMAGFSSRCHPDLNWGWWFCRPLPYHLAMAPGGGSSNTAAGASARVS